MAFFRKDPSVEDVVGSLCRMPMNFYALGSVSMLKLLTDSGVDRCPSALTVPRLSEYIARHPEVIPAWERWCDKPLPSGWLLERAGSGFVVRFYPDGEILEIQDPARACAEYMVREIEHLKTARRRERFHIWGIWPFWRW